MAVVFTLEGLLVGIPLAALVVELARRRWRPGHDPTRRRRRAAALVVLAGVVVIGWPVVIVVVMFAGAFFVAVFALGIRPAQHGRPPSSRPPPSPTPHHSDDSDSGQAGRCHDPYEEECIREQMRAAIERDEEDQRVHEWDQYRWENRSHPPAGPELW